MIILGINAYHGVVSAALLREGQLLAANTGRILVSLYNDSSAALFLGMGSTVVSSTNYSAIIYPNGYFEASLFTGALRGVWASDPNDGGAKITEYT